jgi:hypothetical protein
MGVKLGRWASVKMGTNIILGLGNWSLEGITVDQIETSAFGTVWKSFESGMLDGGTLSFAGNYDPDDTTGQTLLRNANVNATHLTSIRFYVDSTSYFVPDLTSVSPTSYVIITSWNVSTDKSGVAQTTFSGKVSGNLVLV